MIEFSCNQISNESKNVQQNLYNIIGKIFSSILSAYKDKIDIVSTTIVQLTVN